MANVVQTNNQLINNYDTSKFLLGNNSFIKADLTASGADVDTLQGMVMGRISSTGKIVACVATATNGSEYPVGLCVVDKTVADGTTENLNLVNKGKVSESVINFSTANTLNSVIEGRTIRDWLNLLGLELSTSEELTEFDNS